MNNKTINSFLIVMILAMPSLANIIAYLFNINKAKLSTVVFFSFLIIAIVTNKLKISQKNVIIIISSILLFLINIMVVDYKWLVLNEFGQFCIYGLIVLLIASYEVSYKKIIQYWYISSVVFLICIHFLLSETVVRNFGYMHLGFMINFTLVGFILKFFTRRHIFDLFIVIYLLILSLLFGHRGSVLVNLLLIFYFFYKIYIMKPNKVFFGIISFLISIGYLLKDLNIINILESIVSNFNSYTLKKFIISLEKGNVDLAGREIYYTYGFEIVKEKMFLFPSGLGYYKYMTNLIFPHNLLIELYIVFGVMSVFFIFYFCYKFMKVYKNSPPLIQITIVSVFIFSIVRLMTGGSFVTEVSLWVLLGLIFNHKPSEIYLVEGNSVLDKSRFLKN